MSCFWQTFLIIMGCMAGGCVYLLGWVVLVGHLIEECLEDRGYDAGWFVPLWVFAWLVIPMVVVISWSICRQ